MYNYVFKNIFQLTAFEFLLWLLHKNVYIFMSNKEH